MNANCQACPTGYTTLITAAEMADACRARAPGYFSRPGEGCCPKPCPKGTWSPGGDQTDPWPDACTLCPSGLTTAGDGASKAEDCVDDAAAPCPEGWGALPGDPSTCQICPKGTWSRGGNSTVEKPPCADCPQGFDTFAAGEWYCGACAPGHSYFETGCPACPEGTWGPQFDFCEACPEGMSMRGGKGGAAHEDCSVCKPGFGSDTKTYVEGGCKKCLAGFYGLGSNSQSNLPCTQCPPGTLTPGDGANSSSQCLPV